MTASCVHYWIIATPAGGPTAPGTCRKCGETKRFPVACDEPVSPRLMPRSDYIYGIGEFPFRR